MPPHFPFLTGQISLPSSILLRTQLRVTCDIFTNPITKFCGVVATSRIAVLFHAQVVVKCFANSSELGPISGYAPENVLSSVVMVTVTAASGAEPFGLHDCSPRASIRRSRKLLNLNRTGSIRTDRSANSTAAIQDLEGCCHSQRSTWKAQTTLVRREGCGRRVRRVLIRTT